MALAKEDVEQINELITVALLQRRAEMADNHNVRYELEIRERIVRVEEELKHQRELIREGFQQMEKRFEQIEKRFEQIEKRFEQIEKRFEQIDHRFEVMTVRIDRFMIWSFATTLTVGGIVIAAIKYLP